ncbi:hypothetical protein WA026_016953 [Henosepilachna vigintioctopunctata]|uniref:Triple functional domain protein n=1 Tax=Henosepilachna vigintioctopunctata TaxID=420089 RepID=A0AAW1U917_9CUCU
MKTIPNDSGGIANTSSPVNKRRGFSGRKWLPPPLRKLSQGKVDKSQSATPLDRPQLKKTGSDKRIKPPSEMGNKPSVSEGEDEDEHRAPLPLKGSKHIGAELSNGAGDDVDEELELPPAMKPIQEPILVTLPPPGVPDIEENPCKREQHSENSLFRDSKGSETLSDVGKFDELSAQGSSNEASALAFSGDEGESKALEDAADMEKKIESFLRKREFVLKELVDTEEAYVRDLSFITEGYMKTMKDPDCEIQMPEDLAEGKHKMVFGNIEAIYDWHKDVFLIAIKKAIKNPTELAQLFKRYQRKLHMYVVYCKNKPVSEYIVSEYLDTYFEELRVKLGQKLQLCDLLIKPVQRIMKYQLMLKDILKYTERAGLTAEAEQLKMAYEIMVIVPKEANDMMDVGRLQGFDGKITAQGKLLLHGLVTCSDLPGSNNTTVGKNKELQVFLFEQSIIFSDIVGKKTQFTSPQYFYRAHIQVNKMNLEEREDSFILESTDPNKQNVGFVCQVPIETLDQWVTTIKNILQTQKDFLKAIQSPIAYQKELTKEFSSNSDPASMWDPTYRKTVPMTSAGAPSSPVSSSSGKMARKTIHKANTVGIPDQSELNGNCDKTHTPNKGRSGRIFEGFGFKNSLRLKHKSEPFPIEPTKDSKNEVHRRWSETTQPPCDNNIMAPGCQARLICEWPDLILGDIVTIIKYDSGQGYLVRTNAHLEEIWLPAHVLSAYSRRPWSFKFKKPGRKVQDVSHETTIAENPLPEFIDPLRDVCAHSGSEVTFRCRIRHGGRTTKLCWKKLEPEVVILRNAKLLMNQSEEGMAVLTIENIKKSDSGKYSVVISNEYGAVESCAVLTVTDKFAPLQEPSIQIISSASVHLTWESNVYDTFYLEYCRLGSGEWLSPNGGRVIESQSYTIENLTPGETYSFRIIAAQNKLISLPSIAVTLPVADNLRWQQEQFKRRYIELEELDRGRYSIVKRAKDRGTQVEVALKQVTRRKQPHHVTQAEYSLLAGIQHTNIIRGLALFDNAPHPGIDTIVLELVKGPYLFSYLTEREDYTEGEAKNYAKQLIAALSWLHKKDLTHLDIKPENVLIDVSNPTHVLKLIDFGDSVNTIKNVILPPACLEFASPELVLGQPVGKHTDYWAVGVFLYVLLSGVSPFLDDSMEETTANILKCDYCYPEQYFKHISNEAKELISKLLVLVPAQRLSMDDALNVSWFTEVGPTVTVLSAALRTFMQRRHPTNVPASPTSPAQFKNLNIF